MRSKSNTELYTKSERLFHRNEATQLRLQGVNINKFKSFWQSRSKPGKMYQQALGEVLKKLKK